MNTNEQATDYPDEEAPAARRKPMQQRSKDRLERILAVGSELIVRTGSDQVKMNEIAALAGISIGSLYQYFPEKSALIRTLAERYNAASRACIEEALSGVATLDDLLGAYAELIDQYYEIVMAEPVMRDIWSGMQADKQLMALQLAESRICSAMLAAAMARAHPAIDPARLELVAFLTWELGEATIRLAISVDPAEGRALVEAFKRMTLREIAAP
ncbi:TetR/AcrR family transcriptional regulator [Sphingomonas sp. So64.6b]|uniref:TetR/AcrR family transcriptional regulator n=1 Tax=Sphingomonas sp. So64.6b TaxID=2997354 RepID=UPI0015FF3BE5|nr:TetR/AcrR family transcriptional regulator [Sphingomonas sp. So64.6b]QNA86481.1 TetR/AcrR family transcriptional regulator [Sphingomonas sp. So64.6b]